MSGHSKWSTIKRKKAASDEKRGKVFTQHARLITLAARNAGADPEMNAELKLAIQRAKSDNVPNDTIDRAIERATGSKDGDTFEENTYEAYGPSGSAFIIKTITDNKNRTVSEIKRILSDHEGKLAQSGGVKWMFSEKGVLKIGADSDREAAEMVAIENDALDIETVDGETTIFVAPRQLHEMIKALDASGVSVVESGIEMIAQDELTLDGNSKEHFESILEELSDNDDVSDVFTNVKA